MMKARFPRQSISMFCGGNSCTREDICCRLQCGEVCQSSCHCYEVVQRNKGVLLLLSDATGHMTACTAALQTPTPLMCGVHRTCLAEKVRSYFADVENLIARTNAKMSRTRVVGHCSTRLAVRQNQW